MALAPDVSSKLYTPVHDALLLEFLPTDAAGAVATVDEAQLQVGRSYEVVVSTYAGLLRYRLGDVVVVEGFDGRLPLLRFSHRISTLVDLRGERVSEAQLYAALCAANRTQLTDWTAAHHTALGDDALRYHVFVEGVEAPRADAFDAALQERNAGYRYHRREGSIRPPVVHAVSAGTFAACFEALRAAGQPINQIKIPRRIDTKPELVKLLLAREVAGL